MRNQPATGARNARTRVAERYNLPAVPLTRGAKATHFVRRRSCRSST